MKISYHIENLKCNGCANTIRKGLMKIDEVQNVEIDVENALVQIDTNQDISQHLHLELSKMGYPVVGDKNTLGHKAKSFVSCAIGRISED